MALAHLASGGETILSLHEHGFTSDRAGLEFTWSGVIPAEVEAVVGEAKASGVDITIRSIAFTWEQAEAYGRALVDAARERVVRITEWGPNRAHDVIEISGPTLSADADEQQSLRALADELLPAGIGLAFVPDQQADDAAPSTAVQG